MPTELTFFIVGAIIANLLVIGALLALARGRSLAGHTAARDRDPSTLPATRDLADKYAVPDAPDGTSFEELAAAPSYARVLRVLWWVTIAAVLVGVGVSGAYQANQPLIYAVGGAAVLVVVLLHELLPPRWRTPGRFWIEAVLAIGLVTALVALTGYGSSPFFFAYVLVAVAVALVRGGQATYYITALAMLCYIGVLALDPNVDGFTGVDLLRFALNIGSIWLLAFLAGVYTTHERRVRSSVLQLSVTDPLTGLFNRSQIYATLDQEIRRTRRSDRGFCILMIDLDGLKAINDTVGHHRGDDVLRRLGAVIRRSIRTVDTAYRYGGDEFVILLPETAISGAFVVAEKIRAGAEEIGQTIGREGAEASVSIGLVSHPEDGSTVEELMIAADRAMYQAKSLGKNQISGYPHPRRVLTPLPPVATTAAPMAPPTPAVEAPPVVGPPSVAEAPVAPEVPQAAAAEPVAEPITEAPPERATAAEAAPRLRPVEMADGPVNGVNAPPAEGAEGHGDEEPDPTEVRRQIAAASRSFDPDHQIRRAMDAFLSPGRARGERPEDRPD